MISCLRSFVGLPNKPPRFDAKTCAQIKEERLATKSYAEFRNDFIANTQERFGGPELAARLFDGLSKTSPVSPFPVLLNDQFWELYGWDEQQINDELNFLLLDALPSADWRAKEYPTSDVKDIRIHHLVDLFYESRLVFQDTRRPSTAQRIRRFMSRPSRSST